MIKLRTEGILAIDKKGDTIPLFKNRQLPQKIDKIILTNQKRGVAEVE